MPNDLAALLKAKEANIERSANRLVSGVEATQKELLAEVNLILGSMARDSNGSILTNPANLKLIRDMRPRLERLFSQSKYTEAVKMFAQGFDRQQQLSAEYYDELLDYAPTPASTALFDLHKTKALDLLSGGAASAMFYDPVIDVLLESVTTNAGFVETSRAVRAAIVGGQVATGRVVQGGLVRYVRQIAYDSMAIADRSYARQASDDLDIEFYRYTGGDIDDTREFCAERNGEYFHRNEIEEWAELEWAGKHRATTSGSIFTVLGGYNCRHSLIPVSITSVPLDVIQRNIDMGNIELSPSQMEALGMI